MLFCSKNPQPSAPEKTTGLNLSSKQSDIAIAKLFNSKQRKEKDYERINNHTASIHDSDFLLEL